MGPVIAERIRMEQNESFKIPLFDGTNFSHWKYRVRVLLDENDLKIYIDEPLVDIIIAPAPLTYFP